MTFEKEIKLVSLRKINKFILRYFLFLISLFLSCPVQSQTPDFHFSNLSLSDALMIISDHFETTIAFDSEKLGEIKIDKLVSHNEVAPILEELLTGTGFTFIKKYGNYLIVDDRDGSAKSSVPVYELTGSITDKESGENLSFANIWVGNTNTIVSATVTGTFVINKLLSDRLLL